MCYDFKSGNICAIMPDQRWTVEESWDLKETGTSSLSCPHLYPEQGN